MGRNPVRKTHLQMKAEMLLANFNTHSRGVRQRILEILMDGGLSHEDLMYYANNREWPDKSTDIQPDESTDTQPGNFNDYADEMVSRSQTTIIKRKKAAVRNIAVLGGLLFAFLLSFIVMIYNGNDNSKKAVDAIPIEESASTVKDGDSL